MAQEASHDRINKGFNSRLPNLWYLNAFLMWNESPVRRSRGGHRRLVWGYYNDTNIILMVLFLGIQ